VRGGTKQVKDVWEVRGVGEVTEVDLPGLRDLSASQDWGRASLIRKIRGEAEPRSH